ncbi:hydrogenase maturation protease [Streptomyces nojiriensis]|uniref:hydrogenase maturation protease n=1 Tax=Streptomyces nojiriensis TaxID=66374 RepID=UPI002E18ABC5
MPNGPFHGCQSRDRPQRLGAPSRNRYRAIRRLPRGTGPRPASRAGCAWRRPKRKWVPVKPLAGAAVIGIGNEFRRDDGLGWAAISLLRARKAQRHLPSGTELALCDGDPGRLISIWEGKALTLVVDACFPPAAQPGRTHRWRVAPGEMLHPAAAGRQSTHGLGLAEAVCLADRVGRGPGRLIVYAVEGADRSLGAGLTPAVAAALPFLALRIEADVRLDAARGLAGPGSNPGARNSDMLPDPGTWKPRGAP